jgi:hypothetical protein
MSGVTSSDAVLVTLTAASWAALPSPLLRLCVSWLCFVPKQAMQSSVVNHHRCVEGAGIQEPN